MYRIHSAVFRKFLLACVWTLGLVCGSFYALQTTAETASLMRSVTDSRLSIIALFVMMIIPFILSAVLLRLSMYYLLLPLVFFKAFLFSSCNYGLILAFGDAGWLVRWIYLFSDTCCAMLLLWFWCRNTVRSTAKIGHDLIICLVLAVIIGCVESSIISPFAVSLF